MYRAYSIMMIVLLSGGWVNAQQYYLDSLYGELNRARSDTSRVLILKDIAEEYLYIRQDSCLLYARRIIDLAEKINYPYGKYLGFNLISFSMNTSSNYPVALEMAVKQLKIAEGLTSRRASSMGRAQHNIGIINRRMGNDSVALIHIRASVQLYEQCLKTGESFEFGTWFNIGMIKFKLKELDSALFYFNKEFAVLAQMKRPLFISVVASAIAGVFEEKKDFAKAREYYIMGMQNDEKYNALLLKARLYNNFSRYYSKIGQPDSAIIYSRKSLNLCQNNTYGEHASDAAMQLTRIYESKKMPDSAYKYLRLALTIRDTIFSQAKQQQVYLINFNEGQRQRDIAAAKEKYRNTIRSYFLLSTIGLFLLISIILLRNNQRKQKTNMQLAAQRDEIDHQRSKAESALKELKSAQTQLVQSEKMASLGEITAGIAHEIQNPLNFVNNFAEVNQEMLREMQSEMGAKNYSVVNQIAAELELNMEKINHHGKRADAIVKSMLEHSRTSTGQKELTDINLLAEEYLRLAYHGLQAKDKSFKVTIETKFDQSLKKLIVIPNDLGRVMLNLYSNAFYAVMEKKKTSERHFEPTIFVSTKNLGDKVEICVRDNGIGIPVKIKEKVFQPFFTTKPTGLGTGLGLSLSYDIIKSHSGELRLESPVINETGIPVEGTSMIIILPV
jgi:two-component system NtrC family sensor kinase